jgi:hypothetical protein
MVAPAGAKAHADALAVENANPLAVFGDQAAMLRNCARFIVERHTKRTGDFANGA